MKLKRNFELFIIINLLFIIMKLKYNQSQTSSNGSIYTSLLIIYDVSLIRGLGVLSFDFIISDISLSFFKL